eukprot:CAMPEP_0117003470 /NCGR_PEP_ID=MMETSP0472-20121206/4774_1 /TAXON_ID=693140 ORGANISM="Tiarina fusus, Strain LIS" /NCGR_SAMPLE_ID=MMETSP0472 /ASSEMBLY_ACC=CAM_ASM_000603 /LENGTH=1404 /DNA_ID=CAMNT_0004704119 /DNA_START=206 /DNA_END=4423 /DNA_ORIENTATION=-
MSENQLPKPEETTEQTPEIPEDALQGLLSRFGPGFGELLNAGPHRAKRNQKVQQLLSDIRAMGDEMRQLQGLIELCDYFNMSMEELLAGFPIDQFVPSLVELLNYEHNPDIMLITTRALSYMIESIPKSTKLIVQNNAVPIFCNRLMFIQYIDVAEQTLQILGKISTDHYKSVLEAGGLVAVLTYLDFFGTSTQRASVATAANLCRNVEPQNFELVAAVLPLLTNLLLHSDSKIVESAILCFQRLTKSFKKNASQMAAIAAEGLVDSCLQLLTGSAPVGTVERPGIILSILQVVCVQQPDQIIKVLEGGIGPILRNFLQCDDQGTTPTPNNSSLVGLLAFADKIFPSLPPERTPITVKRDRYVIPQPLTDSPMEASQHEKILTENFALFESFAQCVYGPVKETFSANIDTAVRSQCLSVIMKIVYFIPEEQLVPLLKDMGTSTFVANLLQSNRFSYIATAVRLADILLEKMPTIFTKYFTREGAAFGIDRLASPSYLEGGESLDENTKYVKNWIYCEAQTLKAKYFSSTDENETVFATDELKKLVKVLKQLKENNDLSSQKELLETIAEMLICEGGISVFEFLRSGAAESLLEYLTATIDFPKLEERWELFATVMEAGEHSRDPLQALITLLQKSLSQGEKFVILLNDNKGPGSGVKFLAKPFKLKLGRAPDETVLSDFSSNVVGIEPLASVGAVEKFLWDKIQPAVDPIEENDELVIEDNDLDSNDFEEFAEDSEHVLEVQPPQALRASGCLQNRNSENSTPKRLQFYYNGVPLAPSDNIFRILQHEFNKNLSILRTDNVGNVTPAQRLWNTEHQLTYKRTLIASSSNENEKPLKDPILLNNRTMMQYFMENGLAFDFNLPVPDDVKCILKFLKFLHAFVSVWKPTSEVVREKRKENDRRCDLLVNKITLKLSQQLQDTLILCCGELPPWCEFVTRCCSFLLPFDIRRQYFTCTRLGIARALHCLQQVCPPEKGAEQFQVGRIHRQKVRVSRSHILRCVFRVMELYGRSKAVLEVEFFDEAGTGLGPTLEFFTLVSHQLQRSDLGMWCFDKTYHIPSEDNINLDTTGQQKMKPENPLQVEGPFEYVSNKGGLFPRPVRESDSNASFIRKMFQLFGVVAGKAILDERMLDIHLSLPFYKWFVGKALEMSDLEIVYPEIAKSLIEFKQVDKIYREALESCTDKTKEEIQDSIRFRDCSIGDLCLTFVLPSNPDWELKENGKDISVTLDNLHEYIELVIDTLLVSGVRMQMEAFRKGFQSVLPISSLCCFSVSELDAMLCGWTPNSKEYWETHAILDAIECDHQYNINSLPVQYFAAALNLLSDEEKRNFLFFLTGSPRLPIGGFKSLHPRLTVVRKDTEGLPDNYLPSVMTCVNYVKLPAYSSPEITSNQIKRAISEGLSSFHLS